MKSFCHLKKCGIKISFSPPDKIACQAIDASTSINNKIRYWSEITPWWSKLFFDDEIDMQKLDDTNTANFSSSTFLN